MTTPPAADPQAQARADAARFRRTLVKVMAVQVATLLALWLVQRTFTV